MPGKRRAGAATSTAELRRRPDRRTERCCTIARTWPSTRPRRSWRRSKRKRRRSPWTRSAQRRSAAQTLLNFLAHTEHLSYKVASDGTPRKDREADEALPED